MVVPPAYAGLMALPRVHVTPGSISGPLMEKVIHYAYGYAQVGRSKRVVRSLWSTFAGVAVGLFVRQVIIKPQPGRYALSDAGHAPVPVVASAGL